MARTLRQEIIATPAPGMGDGNHSMGRAGLFLSVYIKDDFLGGLETISYDENGGVAFRRNVGNRWNEPEPQPYEVTGAFTRWQVRGKTLRQMLAKVTQYAAGIEWAQQSFDIRMHQYYQSASGGTTFEDTWEVIKDVWVQRISVSQANETGLRTETVSFLARAVIESGVGVETLQSVPSYELGGASTNLDAGHGNNAGGTSNTNPASVLTSGQIRALGGY